MSRRHPPLRWFQYSLGSLFVVLTAVAIFAAWFASRMRPEEVRIRISKTAAVVDGRTAEDIQSLIDSHVARLRSASLNPEIVPVLVEVEDDASYREFRSVIEHCWHAGLRSFFVCQGNQRARFVVEEPRIDPVDLSNPYLLPVKLHANGEGELVGIEVRGRIINSQQPASEVSSTLEAATSAALLLWVRAVVEADDQLEFKYVAAAIDALSGSKHHGPCWSIGLVTFQEPEIDDTVPELTYDATLLPLPYRE